MLIITNKDGKSFFELDYDIETSESNGLIIYDLELKITSFYDSFQEDDNFYYVKDVLYIPKKDSFSSYSELKSLIFHVIDILNQSVENVDVIEKSTYFGNLSGTYY